MTVRSVILPFPDRAAIDAEAAAWIARFDGGQVSACGQAAFQEWLDRSALHREAMAAYSDLWSELDLLSALSVNDDVRLRARMEQTHCAFLERARPFLAGAAAAVLIAVVGGTLFRAEPQQHPNAASRSSAKPFRPPTQSAFETRIGGHRKIALSDGSSVVLNTDSRVEIEFSSARRDVHLTRGEAYFEVVHDKARPFTVYANNYAVRDIGTAFDVHLSEKCRVEVRVTNGSVEVAPANGARRPHVAKALSVVTAGHVIVLGPKVEREVAVSHVEMGRELAWREGELIYSGQRLGEVIADVSRYSNIKIELADPGLENLKVGGAFRSDQIETIFAALEANFGVHAQWITPQYVRFTSRGDFPPPKIDVPPAL